MRRWELPRIGCSVTAANRHQSIQRIRNRSLAARQLEIEETLEIGLIDRATMVATDGG